MSLRDDLHADFARTRETTGGRLRRAPFSVIATVLFRLSHAAKRAERHGLSLSLHFICLTVTGADMHPEATIGPGLFFVHTVGAIVGPGVVAGERLTLYGGTVLGGRQKTGREWGYPTVGDDVTLYTKASVIGPVTVGEQRRDRRARARARRRPGRRPRPRPAACTDIGLTV